MKITITGQEGFIGYHLYNTLKFNYPSFELLDFEKNSFNDATILDEIISSVDIIVHLAGVNRSENQNDILDKNLFLTKQLLNSIERTKFKGKLIFASSIQCTDDNPYGISKKLSSEKFYNASIKNDFTFINLIIPNVFGPFCKPNYNSFIATFCYNSLNDIPNIVNHNKKIPLIYIDNLIDKIIRIFSQDSITEIYIKEDTNSDVKFVKKLIDDFKNTYIINSNIPKLNTQFKSNLFKTYHSYIDSYFAINHSLKSDERGSFTELIRSRTSSQVSFSNTNPNYERGNHFHTRKIERFSVIGGEALIKIRKIGTDKVYSLNLSGKNPSFIDMKVWHTHSIKNIGNSNLITVFWINEFYNENDPDTFFEKV